MAINKIVNSCKNHKINFNIYFSYFFVADTELGTVLTTVSANDVDTSPAITYLFDEEHTDEDAHDVFSIDFYSGKVILKKELDYETRQEYQLKIIASDSKHMAQSTLTIRIVDVNDNVPVFQQPAYHALLPGK